MDERARQAGGNIWNTPRTPRDDFLNLYDVFMNASLQRQCMRRAPVPEVDPLLFLATDRGRFERTYVAFLYVLVEAWPSPAMKAARDYMAQFVSLDGIESAIGEAAANGGIDAMRKVRDYMCHRDLREFWDVGREAVTMQMHTHEAIFMAFSKTLIAVSNAARAAGEGTKALTTEPM